MHPDHHFPDPATDNAGSGRGPRLDRSALSRRQLLGGIGSLLLLSACGTQATDETGSSPTSTSQKETEVASETNGPYPADGTDGTDIRTLAGIVRSDIRSSVGRTGKKGTTAEGVPLTIGLTVTDLTGTPLEGAAVYVWHCDRDGNYSLYSEGVTDENYLRGIQETGSDGTVSFTSVYPACYPGRWPHVHFEVYSSLKQATSGAGTIRKISQMALPEEINDAVFATEGYSASATNMQQMTIASDSVFGDDSAATEMASVTGTVSDGYVAHLTAAINPKGREDTASTN